VDAELKADPSAQLPYVSTGHLSPPQLVSARVAEAWLVILGAKLNHRFGALRVLRAVVAWAEKHRKETTMRRVVLTVLVTSAIGILATSGASAAPMNGAAVGQACTAINSVTQVQHWRWGSWGGHWRWGSRGCFRRCNRWRCWRVC
jgi:hypothetical protein